MSNDEIMDLDKLEKILEDEASSENLQDLDEDFYQKASEELEQISKEKDSNPILDKKEEKFKEYLSEILRIRIIKILYELPYGDLDNLVLDEDKIFNYMKYLISGSQERPTLHKFDEQDKEKVLTQETSKGEEEDKNSLEDLDTENQVKTEENLESVKEETGKKEELDSKLGSESKSLTRGSSPVEDSSEVKSVGYLLLEDTPEMMDSESSKFGPFGKGDLVNLPVNLGNILVERGVAEKMSLNGLEED